MKKYERGTQVMGNEKKRKRKKFLRGSVSFLEMVNIPGFEKQKQIGERGTRNLCKATGKG